MRFKNEIEIGDLVVLPLKQKPSIAVGRVMSDYELTENSGPDIIHIRRVKWVTKDMPRICVRIKATSTPPGIERVIVY